MLASAAWAFVVVTVMALQRPVFRRLRLALFGTDNGPSSLIWAWRGDLLTNRLIGVMLLTIAVGAAYSRRYADLSRIMLGVITVYGGGVVVANLWNVLVDRPFNVAYLAVLGGIFAISALLLVNENRKPRSTTPDTGGNGRWKWSIGMRSSR
jgi:hypothetical protein